MTQLSTPRLFLDALRAEDADEMAVVLGDERLHTYIGDAPLELADLRVRYQFLERGSRRPQEIWVNWILRQRTDHAAVGTVQATITVGESTRTATIAWVVGVPWQGNGYAGEAAIALVTWLRTQGVDRIEAHIHPEHAASAAVATRAGLTPSDERVDGETVWWG
ncbi:MAG: GNAT family N-acetyltransferase [Sporichthyaceae bacterium]